MIAIQRIVFFMLFFLNVFFEVANIDWIIAKIMLLYLPHSMILIIFFVIILIAVIKDESVLYLKEIAMKIHLLET